MWATCGLAIVFLVAHLPFLARSPDDIDAVNFALALRQFEPLVHQPHPPGYPVFVALGQAADKAVGLLWPARRDISAATALALLSAVLGALAVFPLRELLACIELNDRRALAGTVLTASCPLFWFASVRPMSDMTGLAASLVAQALAAVALRHDEQILATRLPLGAPAEPAQPHASLAGVDRLLVLAALIAGCSIGIRSQAFWLTCPLLGLALWNRRRLPGHVYRWCALAFAAGIVAWAIPLLVATGGPRAYWRLLVIQGSDDVAGVQMLALHPGLRSVLRGLYATLVWPWVDARLAAVVLGLAAIGAVSMRRSGPTARVLMAAAALPYAVFHFLFQDTASTRYALPLIPPIAYLAVRGLEAMAPRIMIGSICALVMAGLSVAWPITTGYGRQPSPVFRAVQEVREHAESETPRPALGMHEAMRTALRGEALPLRVLPSPVGYEWFEVVKYWSAGGSAPVWFLANPRQTDLALIDPVSRRLIRRYEWPSRENVLLEGARPLQVDWYEIRTPGWFLGKGWSLTAEVAGVAHRDHLGPGYAPIEAFIRGRTDAATLMVGGHHPLPSVTPPVEIRVALDGSPLVAWRIPSGPNFLRFCRLPPGRLTAREYVLLELSAVQVDEHTPVDVAIDQFDLRSGEMPIWGFDVGWYAPEYDAATGDVWRWTGPQANLQIENFGREVVVHLRGKSPRRWFAAAPHVALRAGSHLLMTSSPTGDFEWSVPVSAAVLQRSGGIVTLETDRTFVPDRTAFSGDRRQLGLRMFDVRVGWSF